MSRSRQRLVIADVVLVDVLSTAERIGPAAATLMQLVTSRGLVHDGNAELARQMARLAARPTPKGWAIGSGTGEAIVAAQAALLAIQRAITAPQPPVRQAPAYGSFR